jgi:hypothetical protein
MENYQWSYSRLIGSEFRKILPETSASDAPENTD